ncbi:MAG: DNA polymerase III subunit gamma/tau [Dehalococcoidia bacterium]|nr:DNA polymerase III subunit gamma/tau [Dehalococcoidia bacterium]
MAFYRKWRPQTLSEVVGQEHVTKTLLNALTTNRVAHAYLFCGPRGTGKTSTGRIMAKALNCTKKGTGGKGEPCNKCAMCQAITEGHALDVIEIDAASHTSVDDVRQLIERINYAPAEAKYKVYIIDEVHQISTSASNALLKTLEEPPPNIVFILATTETHKMLPTIISRCQRFDFRRLRVQDTEEKLNRITEAEGITVAPEALRLVARAARGGLRDAENLLEQLYTFYGANITLPQVHELLGMGGGERARELLGGLAKNDLALSLQVVSRAQGEGLDLRQLNRDLVSYLHAMLLVKSGAEKDTYLETEELSELKALTQDTPLSLFTRSLKLFGEAQKELGESSLPMELAIIDVLMPTERTPQIQTEPTKRTPPPAAKPHVLAGELTAEVPAISSAAATEHPAVSPQPPSAPKPTPKPMANAPFEPIVASASGAVPLTSDRLEQLRNSWRHIIENAPDNLKRSPAVAIMRSAGVMPIAIDNGVVTLSFRHNFHKEKIEEIENRRVAANLISQFLGQPCQVKCIYEPAENHLVREAQKLGAQVIDIEEKIPTEE